MKRTMLLLLLLLLASVSGAFAADHTLSCRLANGNWRKCPPVAVWMTRVPSDSPLADFDGQPRPFTATSGVYAGTWHPLSPKTCKVNTVPDAGSDEFYARGCPPLYGTWVSDDGKRRLSRYGVVTKVG